jgi:hypothetical protein
MQLLKPHINNIGSTKSKPSAKQLQAKAEHEAWLKRNGVHPEQLKHKPKAKTTLPSYKTEKVQLSNTIVDGGRDRSIMSNLYKESVAVQRKILEKAKRTEIAYNKGGLVYVTDEMDIKTMGSRSRRP